MTPKKSGELEEPAWLHQRLIIRDEAWKALRDANSGYLVVRQDALRLEKEGIPRFYDLGVDVSEQSVQLLEFYNVPLLGGDENSKTDLQTRLLTRNLEERCERIFIDESLGIALYDLLYGEREFRKRPFLTEATICQKAKAAVQEKIRIIIEFRMQEYTKSLLRSYPYAVCSKAPFPA